MPITSMILRFLFLMWCSTAGVCAFATQVDQVLQRDLWSTPWMLRCSDGGIQFGIIYQGSQQPAGRTELSRVDSGQSGPQTALPVSLSPKVTWQAIKGRTGIASVVLQARLDAKECKPGHYTLTVGGHSFSLSIPEAPGAQMPARVAIIGAWNYPRANDLAKVGQDLGGAVQLVIGIGPELGDLLGTGDWESQIPLVILDGHRHKADTNPSGPDALAFAQLDLHDLAGAALDEWPSGTHWGVLGFPLGDVTNAIHAIAADLSPWQVFVESPAAWNPGCMAPALLHQPSRDLPLLALCQRMAVPLILSTTGPAGWVSEPLGIDNGALTITPGGTRCMGATPAGAGLSALPTEIAFAFDQPAVIGVVGEPLSMTVVVQASGSAPAIRLCYLASADRSKRLGTAWGQGDVVDLKKAWKAQGKDAAGALDALVWLPAVDLGRVHFGNEDIQALVTASAKDSQAMLLLHHLTGVQALAEGELQSLITTLPPLIGRDLVLRSLATGKMVPGDLADFASTSSDEKMLEAMVLAYEQAGDLTVLSLLVKHVARQAQGNEALAGDAVLEHRLLCAVFDSMNLSPTPLRPLAASLLERISEGWQRGPLDRFIARHGAVRPP